MERELADVLLVVLRFADVAEIDLQVAMRNKLNLDARRYPRETGLGP